MPFLFAYRVSRKKGVPLYLECVSYFRGEGRAPFRKAYAFKVEQDSHVKLPDASEGIELQDILQAGLKDWCFRT